LPGCQIIAITDGPVIGKCKNGTKIMKKIWVLLIVSVLFVSFVGISFAQQDIAPATVPFIVPAIVPDVTPSAVPAEAQLWDYDSDYDKAVAPATVPFIVPAAMPAIVPDVEPAAVPAV
jgi:hypothetical protein